MCGARWCISPSKKNSCDYFPYFFVVLHGHKSEGETKKKRKIFYWKMEGASDFVFCWAIESRVAQRVHTHTHTYAHSISLVMLLPSPSLYKLRISCGRTKAKRHQIFFFSFSFFYTRPVNNPFTILFRLSLSPIYRLSTRALLCVCVCVYWFLLSFRPQEGFSLWLTDFLFSSLHSRCVSLLDLSISLIIIKLHFASIYALDNWNFIFFSFPYLSLFYLFLKRILFHPLTPFQGKNDLGLDVMLPDRTAEFCISDESQKSTLRSLLYNKQKICFWEEGDGHDLFKNSF